MLLKSLKGKLSHSNAFRLVFSNEAFEDFPRRRWLKTKIQVICKDYLNFIWEFSVASVPHFRF